MVLSSVMETESSQEPAPPKNSSWSLQNLIVILFSVHTNKADLRKKRNGVQGGSTITQY